MNTLDSILLSLLFLLLLAMPVNALFDGDEVRLQDLGSDTTADTNAIGAYRWSAYKFTANWTGAISNIEIFVAQTGGLSSNTNAGLYRVNSTLGIVPTLIGSNSTILNSFGSGQRYNFTFTENTSLVENNSIYAIVFWASGSGNFIRVGETKNVSENDEDSVWGRTTNAPIEDISFKGQGSGSLTHVNIKIYGFENITVPTTNLSFYNESSNTGTLSNNGTATFSININDTNGTVFLELGNVNYSTSNLSFNYYNRSVFLFSNSYFYKWIAYDLDGNIHETAYFMYEFNRNWNFSIDMNKNYNLYFFLLLVIVSVILVAVPLTRIYGIILLLILGSIAFLSFESLWYGLILYVSALITAIVGLK